MPRGQPWTQEEISCLLELVGRSEEASMLMASTSRPNEGLWREISQGLAAAGYERSVAQCRSKWKALKQAFHLERETCQRDGHHSPRLPPHYRHMKNMWEAAGEPAFGKRRMPDLEKQPSKKRRSAHAACSPVSSEPSEHDVGRDTPGGPLSPLQHHVKEEPDSSSEDYVSEESPASPAVPCSHTAVKEEEDEQNTGFPDKTSLGMQRGNKVLPVATAALGSTRTATMMQQPAVGEEASDASLHGSVVAGLLQSIQQLLVQILQTSQQQQVLLETLATDTTSNLYVFSQNMMQVGETLQQLLLQPQNQPNFFSHYNSQVAFPESVPRVFFSDGTPYASTSSDYREVFQNHCTFQ